MEANRSNLLLGLAIGSVVGVFAHRFSRTTKAKILKRKFITLWQQLLTAPKSLQNMPKRKSCMPAIRLPKNGRRNS